MHNLNNQNSASSADGAGSMRHKTLPLPTREILQVLIKTIEYRPLKSS
ncbi:MAG: hypothetical protein IPP42_04665 [Saprospiraceae bacterium]|nr:hypothetical protein [Saprospiraceae bacterium]